MERYRNILVTDHRCSAQGQGLPGAGSVLFQLPEVRSGDSRLYKGGMYDRYNLNAFRGIAFLKRGEYEAAEEDFRCAGTEKGPI